MKKTCYFCGNYDSFNIQCKFNEHMVNDSPDNEPCEKFKPNEEYIEYRALFEGAKAMARIIRFIDEENPSK